MTDDVASPNITTKAKLSSVWLIPFVAVLIAVWMFYSHYSRVGPLVKVSFEDAAGLEVNKTPVKLRNVEIGKVESLEFNENFDGVWVGLRLEKAVTGLLVEDATFWVVRPRVGREGISGFDTLLSGAYIELSAGTSDSREDEFIGLEKPPATPQGTPGLHLTLENSGNTLFSAGDPIIYRGLVVGKIDYVHFNADERKVYYNAFIEEPYDRLVTTNTRFWEINGFEIDLGAEGLRVETGSLETLLTGGLGFDVPKNMPAGEVVTERRDFVIYPGFTAINDVINHHSLEFALLFSNSIRGLRPGASVEYRGVKVGSVLRTDIDYPSIDNILNKNSVIPVLVSIEPARIGLSDTEKDLQQAKIDVLNGIKQGLSGGLATANFVTGSQYVELVYEAEVKAAQELEYFEGYVVIPAAANQLDALLGQAESLLNKINKLPVEPLLKDASAALVSIRQTSDNLERVFSEEQGQALLASIDRTVNSLDKLVLGVSSGSETRELLDKDLKSLRHVLDELLPLLSQLNKKPNSLIFGKPQQSSEYPGEE